MAEDFGERTQDPTPHRRRQMRERGQVAHSQDLSSAGLLLGGLGVLIFSGGALLEFLAAFLATSLSGQGWMAWVRAGGESNRLAVSQWNVLVPGLARVLLPVLGLILLLAVLTHVVQTGFLFLPRRLVPDFSRVNPLAGWGRVFSSRGAARLTFGIFKIAAIGSVAAIRLVQRRDELVSLAGLDLPQIAFFAWDACLWTCIDIAAALAVLAGVDYLFQRWKHEREARMTPQEVREEMRELQGNPQVVARRRDLRRQLAHEGPSSTVRQADVVIAAPTGLAVALRYDERSMRAPTVLTKAAGAGALRIRRLADENSIPIVDVEQLAAALHKSAQINQPIPDKLFAEVAQVLAYANELNRRSAEARA